MVIGAWSEPELLVLLDQLDGADLADLLGAQPTQLQFEQIGFPELQTVLTSIGRSDPDLEPVIRAPSVRKIAFNQLSADTTEFIRVGRRRERAVQDFLEKWPDPSLGDQIAETLRRRYLTLRETSLSNEEIFVDLLRFVGFNRGPTSSCNAAVLAVITYLFERCEIFEDPNGTVSSP